MSSSERAVMGSSEQAVMGFESRAVSARVTKHFLLFLVKHVKIFYNHSGFIQTSEIEFQELSKDLFPFLQESILLTGCSPYSFLYKCNFPLSSSLVVFNNQ